MHSAVKPYHGVAGLGRRYYCTQVLGKVQSGKGKGNLENIPKPGQTFVGEGEDTLTEEGVSCCHSPR